MGTEKENFTVVKSEVFRHEKFGCLRVMIDHAGDSWFVGKVVAEALGYVLPTKALSEHIERGDSMLLTYKAFSKMEKASGLWSGNDFSNKVLINESGLYSLILGSKLPQARVFKHWVTGEVLPQIRKTGGYIPMTPSDSPRGEMGDAEILSRALLIAQKTIELKNHLLTEQKPLVDFAHAVTAAPGSILIRDLAKLLTKNGIEVGQNRLFKWLRDHEFIFKRGTSPMQEWVEKGIFETSVTMISTHHGSEERLTTKVTGKGQRFFIEGFTQGRFRIDN